MWIKQGLLAFAQHQSQQIQAVSSKTVLSLFDESQFGQHVYLHGAKKLTLEICLKQRVAEHLFKTICGWTLLNFKL